MSGSRHGQLSAALLQDQDAGQSSRQSPPPPEFLGLSDDEGRSEEDDEQPNEDQLSSTPMIMGSPFPYLFQQHVSKRRIVRAINTTRLRVSKRISQVPTVDTSHASSMEEGEAAAAQSSKLVRELVHASA